MRLKSHLEQSHPADKLLSPDFNDHYNADGTIKRHPAGDSFVRALRQALRQRRWAVRQRDRLAPVRRGQAQEHGEHRRPRLHARTRPPGAGLPIWVTEAGAHVTTIRRRPDRGRAGRSGEVDDGHDLRACVTRPHHPDALLQRAPGARHRSSTCQPLAGFPWDIGPRAGVRRQAAGVVHVVPRGRPGDAACYDDSPGRRLVGPVPPRRLLARQRRRRRDLPGRGTEWHRRVVEPSPRSAARPPPLRPS